MAGESGQGFIARCGKLRVDSSREERKATNKVEHKGVRSFSSYANYETKEELGVALTHSLG